MNKSLILNAAARCMAPDQYEKFESLISTGDLGERFSRCISKVVIADTAGVKPLTDEQEPFAWHVATDSDTEGSLAYSKREADDYANDGYEVIPLYTRAALASPASDIAGENEREMLDIAEQLDEMSDRITRFSNYEGDAVCARAAQLLRQYAAPANPVNLAEFETAIETLRHVIHCLRQNGSYTDEEGEATDYLEPLLEARLAAPPAPSVADAQVDDLRMLVQRLVHALNKASPSNDLGAKALDYLQRNSIGPSPLRESSVADAAGASDCQLSDEWIEMYALRHIAPHASGFKKAFGLDVPYQQTEQFERVKAYTQSVCTALKAKESK